MPDTRVARRPLPRSYLYVPGHREDLWEKARRSGADAIVLDLEDGVPVDERRAAAAVVDRVVAAADGGPEVCVRVSGDDEGLALLAGLECLPRLQQVLLAKAEEPEQVAVVAQHLRDADSRAGVCLLVESAAGVMNLARLLAVPGVVRGQLGETDLRASLRVPTSPFAADALLGVRSWLVVTSAAQGAQPPTASVSTGFRDLTVFRADTERMRGLGFFGRTCIHPAQVPVVNEVFTPDENEVGAARALLDDAPVGGGAHTAADGSMVDEAVLRHARQVLDAAEAYGVRTASA